METINVSDVVVSDENQMDFSANSLEENLSVDSIAIEDNEVTDELNTSKTSPQSNDNKSIPKSKKKRKLTPEERKRFLEDRNKRKQEKEAQERQRKEDFQRKKLEKMTEKQKRDKEKQEKEAERQRIKDIKQKEKEEKQKERDLEKQKKHEEFMAKKRKTDEEMARKEEENRKKAQKEEKQKSILKNFFIKKSDESVNRKSLPNSVGARRSLFLPFQLGENQTIAPIIPELAKTRFNRQELDRLIVTQDSNQLYLDLLKTIDYKPFKYDKSRHKDEPEIITETQSENEDNHPKRYRVKHLQFDENVRPPYRGTFRKYSSKVKATQPFNKDSDIFDYEVDSELEWEEDGDGESLNGSDSDGSVKDDYEIDNEFFVPHGYLSEDENEENGDKISEAVDNQMETNEECDDQKELKCQPLLKEQVLMAERNRAFSSTLTPLVIGCIWESNPNNNKKSIDSLMFYKRMSITTK